MNRGIWIITGFLILAVISCLISGCFAAFFGMTVGGVGTAVAPGFSFGLVEDWVCPDGSTFEYSQPRYSYHEPGESTIEASCITEEGKEIRGQEFKLIGLVMLAYTASCFTPLILIGLVFSVVIVIIFSRLIKPEEDTDLVEI